MEHISSGNLVSGLIRNYLRDGFWYVLSDLVQQSSAVMVTLLIARFASKEVLGEYQLVLAVVSTVAVVSALGFDSVVLRDAARSFDGIFYRVLRIRAYLSILAVPILVMIAWFFESRGQRTVALLLVFLAPIIPFHYLFLSWISFLRGKQQSGLYATYSISKSLLVLVAVAFFVKSGSLSAMPIVISFFTAQVFVNAWAVLRIKKVVKNNSVSEDWKSYGYFLSKVGIAKIIATHIDKILIGFLFSPAILATYYVAIIIPNSLMLVLKSGFVSFLPALSRVDNLRFKDVGLFFLLGLAAVGLCLIVVIYLLVPVFGEEYRDSIEFAKLAAWGLLFLPLSQLFVNYAVFKSRKKIVVLSKIGSPLVRLFLLLVLGKLLGLWGYVIVFALTPFIWCAFCISGIRVNFETRSLE